MNLEYLWFVGTHKIMKPNEMYLNLQSNGLLFLFFVLYYLCLLGLGITVMRSNY